jgi:hypothetical protein
VRAVARLWEREQPEVERPPDGRIGVWIREWDDDEALRAALVGIRRRGGFSISLNYVHACLASERRNGGARGRPAADPYLAEMLAPGRRYSAPPLDIPARLAALARALPTDVPEVGRWRARVLDLATCGGEVDRIEAALGRLDRELLEDASVRLEPATASDLRDSVSRSLAAVAERVPAAERRELASRHFRRLLRRRLGLPLLSLFSPAAEDPEPDSTEGSTQ